MCTRLSVLDAVNVQSGRTEIYLIPFQVADFRSPHAVSIGNKDHRRIAVAVPIALCGLNELLNLGLGQVLSAAEFTVRPT
jgi:hypothetical protein